MAKIKVKQLCYTGQTLYLVDDKGRLWFVNMRTGEFELDDRLPEEPS